MAEQDHLITDDNWQKRKCSKCGEWKYATGYGGETRQWGGYRCPDCRNRKSVNDQFKARSDEVDWPYVGAFKISKHLRSRNKFISMHHPDKMALARTAKLYWGNVRHKYGIRKIDWVILYSKQEGKCGICREVELTQGGKTVVDHDHKTGKVRGLLCFKCNTMLAPLDESGWLDKALRYMGQT